MQDSKRHTDVQNSLLDSVEEGEGGKIWENGIETCIISYVKRITSPKHAGSCIEPGLVIRFIYDIIHVSMPFCQIIPPLPLPQSPKDYSIHQCVFCCLIHRVIVTIILISIYMHQYTVLVFFFLAYFTLYNRLQFHPPHQN